MTPRRLELVDAIVVPDAAAAVRGDVTGSPVPRRTGAVVAFAPNARYVFIAEDWLELIEEVRGQGLSTAQIELLITKRWQQADVVAPGEEPSGPAIVMDGEEVVGAWIASGGVGALARAGRVISSVCDAFLDKAVRRRNTPGGPSGYRWGSRFRGSTLRYRLRLGESDRDWREREGSYAEPSPARSPPPSSGRMPSPPDQPQAADVGDTGVDGNIGDYEPYPPTPWNASPRDAYGSPGPYEDAVRNTPGFEEYGPEPLGGDTPAGDGTGGGDPATENPDVVHRTPHLDVPDEPLEAGQTVTVEVYTDTKAPRPGEVVEGMSLRGETLDLYIWLLVSEHFERDFEPVQPFRIHRATPRSTSVLYELSVVRDPPHGTQPSIAAVFFHEGRQAGKVERQVRVAGVAEAPPSPGRREAQPPGVGVEPRSRQPDMTVAISRSGDDQSWECAVSTPHLDRFTKPVTERWPLPPDSATLINQRMEKFAEKGLSPLKRRARLVGAGKALYEYAPKLFANVYADLVANGKPLDAILIATEEATFPWELLVPDGGDRPLGVRHAVGRWTHPKQLPTKERVAVRDGYVIAPDYPSDKRKLKHAAPEVKYVRETFSCEPVDPPSVERLNAALGERPVGLLHFVCHGAAPDGRYAQSLYLLQEVDGEFKEEEFDDEMLRGLAGVTHGVKSGTPLVFLNACEAGRQIPSLMGTAGMAKAFITEGALGVIAPLWRVRDTLAAQIAVDIYAAAIALPDTPLADIVRDVRARTYDEPEAEDSYAAYCFFGDPHTRLERVEPS